MNVLHRSNEVCSLHVPTQDPILHPATARPIALKVGTPLGIGQIGSGPLNSNIITKNQTRTFPNGLFSPLHVHLICKAVWTGTHEFCPGSVVCDREPEMMERLQVHTSSVRAGSSATEREPRPEGAWPPQ